MSTATDTPAAQLAAALASLLSTSMDATVTGHVVTLSVAGQVFELTVGESIEAQLAGLKRGNALTARQAQEFDGRCPSESSRGSYSCTRKRGHSGVHVATYGTYEGDTVCCEPWGGEITAAAPTAGGTAKYDSFRAGDTIEPEDYAPVHSWCNNDGNGHRCVLTPGHAGKHVAANGARRLECDPWSEEDKRDPFSSWSLRTADRDPTDGPDEEDPCGFSIRGDECTRVDGHSGNHVSGDGDGDGIRDWCRPDGSGGMHG